MLTVSLTCMMLLSFAKVHAQEGLHFPKPAGNANQLFYLQRSENTNTVIYELNKKDGVLDTVAPVHIYWICYAEPPGPQIKELPFAHFKLTPLPI